MLSNIPTEYEDGFLLIVNKPPGLLTTPGADPSRKNLAGILNSEAKRRGLKHRFHPCHRLDKETSGLIIFAKGKAAQEAMMEAFRYRRVKKKYIAFVQGAVPAAGTIDRRIEGEQAVTAYTRLQQFKRFAVLEVKPETGRKNQIRLHFKMTGHPLVGETRFALRRDSLLRGKRAFLHAQCLEFEHPLTGVLVRVQAPMPRDMAVFLKKHSE
jgi:23S rRNA pseudouridine1911/1915/1917 synthase